MEKEEVLGQLAQSSIKGKIMPYFYVPIGGKSIDNKSSRLKITF